jgi:exonuclease SbcC
MEIEDRELSIREELAHFQLALPAVEESANFVAGLQKEIVDYHAKEKQCDHLDSLTVQLLGELSGFQNQIADKQVVNVKLKTELEDLQIKLKTISEERNTLLPLEVSVEQKRNQLKEVLEIAKSKLDAVLKRSQLLQTAHVSSSHEMESLAKEMSQLNEEILKLNVEMDAVISSGDFASRTALVEALLSAEDKNRYQSMVKSIENKVLEIKALSAQNQKDIQKLESEKDFEITANEAHQRKLLLEIDKKQLLERTGEIKEKFQLDEQIKVRNQSVYLEISKQELVVKKWNDLMNLLGGSKDAFNTYVQRLTLHNLIQLANVHLFKLNKRYSLRMDETYKPGEELYFKLIDHFQTDEARYVDTSSGGEKFLISLALALGLSDLASNNVSIDSLFIDEGFGTLDTQTLETVIATLETLQAQGKMIGIISHVDNLKERIHAQIRVVKKSHGVSEVEIN